jgi:trehalose-6-phosphate synthase
MAVFLFAGKHGFRRAEIIKRARLYFYAMLRFQTKNDRDNFADYLVRQGATQTRRYRIDGRRVRLGLFPVSIETKAYMGLARNAGRSAMLALVRETRRSSDSGR